MIDYLAELERRNVDCDDESEQGNIIILCPFHNDNSPSCHVSLQRGGFHCWGCHETGSFFKLIGKIDGVPSQIAKQRLWSKVTIDDALSHTAKLLRELGTSGDTVRVYIKNEVFERHYVPLTIAGLAYLQRRGISKKMADLYGVRFGELGRYKNRVILPIRDIKGRLVSYTGRTIVNATPKTLKARPPHSTLFGLYELMQLTGNQLFKYLILVESEFSAMYLQQFGLPAISTMGSHGLSVDQINQLIKYVTGRVYVSYDKDGAGEKATARDTGSESMELQLKHPLAIHRFLPVTSIEFPDTQAAYVEEVKKAKDPNDLNKKWVLKIYGNFINKGE